MLYTIVHLHGSRKIASESHRGDIEGAKAMAVNAVGRGAADRAEVRDVHGRLVFHHPRTFPI